MVLSDVLKARIEDLLKQEDSWMTPAHDNLRAEDECGEDYLNFRDASRRGWEETCHYEFYYGRHLKTIFDEQKVLKQFEDADDRYEYEAELSEAISDVFWDKWAEINKLELYWKQHVATK